MSKQIDANDPAYDLELNPSLHSLLHPFCYDMSCDCHEDSTFVGWLNADVTSGLLTLQEADNLYRRKNI